MGFVLRGSSNFTAGTWITATGQTTALPDGAFTAVPLGWHGVAGRDVPIIWQVTLPERNLDVVVSAMNPDAWMTTSVPYWEGPVTVTGSHSGIGYLEMTGYEND